MIALLLAPKKVKADEFLSNFSGFLWYNNSWTKNAINLVKTTIQSSPEHLNIYKISFQFNKQVNGYGSFYFTKLLYEINTPHLGKLWNYKGWLSPFFDSFYKDILLRSSRLRPATLLKKRPWYRCFSVNFVKFLRTPFYRTPLVAASENFPNIVALSHRWPFKSDELFNFKLFLANCYCNIFWTTNAINLFSKPCLKYHNYYEPSKNFNTSCIEINTLFAIFNNKKMGNFRDGPTQSILQGIDHGQWKVFPSISATKLVTQTSISEKVTVLKKYLLLEKQEVPASNKNMFRIIILKK